MWLMLSGLLMTGADPKLVSDDTMLAFLQGRADANCQDDTGEMPLHLMCIECDIAGAEAFATIRRR